MGRGASVACKSAETREQRARPDLNCTDHGESLFTVAENRFGGTEQFRGSGE
jgi:predicted ATPase